MHRNIPFVRFVSLGLMGLVTAAVLAAGEDEPERKEIQDRTSASRLRAVREIMGQITMTSTAGEKPQPLALKPDPLLRYNDVTRGILDSVVFRVGTTGRPVALISAELYGREGTRFLLNHEFVALYNPKLRMERDSFTWEPEAGTLKFQTLPQAMPPAENPRQRLAQMRRLAGQFTASQTVGKSQIVLRRLSAPLDRYEPSDKPHADGAMFAFVWGVNPEAVVFLETDGTSWRYAWAPLSSAPLVAKLGDAVVWECPRATEHESMTAAYTSIHRPMRVPDYFDDPVEEEPQGKP